MNNAYSKKIIEWGEPKYFYKLKQHLEHKDKSFIKKIGIFKIITFFLLFSIIISYWSSKGNIAGIEMSFIPALLLSITSSIIIIFFYALIDRFIGYSIITLNDGLIFYNQSGKNLKQWKCKDIKSCKILEGKYNNKKYKALELKGRKGLIGIFFLSNKIKIDEVLKFFKINGINCN